MSSINDFEIINQIGTGAFSKVFKVRRKIDNEIYGRVLRTHSGVKPIFLSIGNKIDLDTAMQITNTLVTKDSHIPLPTRLADIMTHEIRKKYI